MMTVMTVITMIMMLSLRAEMAEEEVVRLQGALEVLICHPHQQYLHFYCYHLHQHFHHQGHLDLFSFCEYTPGAEHALSFVMILWNIANIDNL